MDLKRINFGLILFFMDMIRLFMQIELKFSGIITDYIEINLKLTFYHLIASVIIVITS